jgi:SWI/SNF-related matrix-associated actin-dependent regulator 1 of chromatin subfamily A
MPHQLKAKNFIIERKWVLIGDEQGLGKTIEALSILRERRFKQVLVVCPSMHRFTWEQEVEAFFEDELDTYNPIVQSGKEFDFDSDDNTIHIVSYEGLSKIPLDFKPQVLIFDESHYLKNLQTTRTQLAHDLAFRTQPEYLILLSGTPVTNNVTEFYSPLKLLSYCPYGTNGLKLSEKSQYAFNTRFSHRSIERIYVRGEYIDVTKYKGIRNPHLLKEYLKSKYIRRLSKNVLDLPEIVDKEILLTKSLKRSDKVIKKEFQDYRGGSHTSTAKADNAFANAKSTVKYVIDLLSERDAIVIFTDHPKAAQEIHRLLPDGIKKYCLTGAIPAKSRRVILDEYQAYSGKQVLVATIGSASTGYTITRARDLVFNDLPWVPTVLSQARKRIHRIGQTGTCVIHYIYKSPVDAYIRRALDDKLKVLGKEIL